MSPGVALRRATFLWLFATRFSLDVLLLRPRPRLTANQRSYRSPLQQLCDTDRTVQTAWFNSWMIADLSKAVTYCQHARVCDVDYHSFAFVKCFMCVRVYGWKGSVNVRLPLDFTSLILEHGTSSRLLHRKCFISLRTITIKLWGVDVRGKYMTMHSLYSCKKHITNSIPIFSKPNKRLCSKNHNNTSLISIR